MERGSAGFLGFVESCDRWIPRSFQQKGRERKSGCVVPKNIPRVQKELAALRDVKDIGSLDAKIEVIDSYLKKLQDSFNEYLVAHRATERVGRIL